MIYDQQILSILTVVGERGISIAALTKHIYNQNTTFFSQPNLAEVKQYVQQYLLKNSKSSQSLIESTGKRGYYRLNTTNSADARQLLLDFKEDADEKEDAKAEESKKSVDHSLSLFD